MPFQAASRICLVMLALVASMPRSGRLVLREQVRHGDPAEKLPLDHEFHELRLS